MRLRTGLLLAVVASLLGLDWFIPEPRLCPYRIHDWTVAGRGGEYGLIDRGYVAGSYPSIRDAIVLAGPLGACGLARLAVRANILAVLAVAAWLAWRDRERAGAARRPGPPGSG